MTTGCEFVDKESLWKRIVKLYEMQKFERIRDDELLRAFQVFSFPHFKSQSTNFSSLELLYKQIKAVIKSKQMVIQF